MKYNLGHCEVQEIDVKYNYQREVNLKHCEVQLWAGLHDGLDFTVTFRTLVSTVTFVQMASQWLLFKWHMPLLSIALIELKPLHLQIYWSTSNQRMNRNGLWRITKFVWVAHVFIGEKYLLSCSFCVRQTFKSMFCIFYRESRVWMVPMLHRVGVSVTRKSGWKRRHLLPLSFNIHRWTCAALFKWDMHHARLLWVHSMNQAAHAVVKR